MGHPSTELVEGLVCPQCGQKKGQYHIVETGRGIHLVPGQVEVIYRRENTGATRLHYYPYATGSVNLNFFPASKPEAKWGIGGFILGGGAPLFSPKEWGLDDLSPEDALAIAQGQPGKYRATLRNFRSG